MKESVENKTQTVLKTILSHEPNLSRQRKLPKYGSILTKLGFKDLKLDPLAHGFTFPNATDIFGLTEDYWRIFDGIQRDENSYKTLDLAGQLVLCYAIDRFGGPRIFELRGGGVSPSFLRNVRSTNYLMNSEYLRLSRTNRRHCTGQ